MRLHVVPFFVDDAVYVRVGPPLGNHARPCEVPNLGQPVSGLNGHGYMLVRGDTKTSRI
jgi:hypothetical protein